MRKLAVLIACLLAVTLSACSVDQQSTTAAPNADTAPTLAPSTGMDPTVVPSTGNGSTVDGEGTTLMIYMVGSDLEAKTAAGTSDLEEIRSSGVDLHRNNVIICAGGAAKWHNDMTSADSLNYLQLTEEGYRVLCSLPAASMGDQSCLADFLCYGYTQFPAADFALILWDHGNGPVIGYGKDMLFDNDTLTLGEMRQALEASPFGPENKLAWVGFDACLMASAELATVWADYAAYLVASQEIEPSFGWDYAFLQSLGMADAPELLTGLTRQYLEICQAYYEKKGYDDRDTTLSCIDLSLADDMEAAINDLFARAAADVGTKYSLLTAKRVQTRALGRASTGSEYDLIDLKDLAAQMLELYPQEATRLQETVDADPNLIYVGLNRNFEVITDFVYSD